MLAIANIILPIFALIFLGFGFRRLNIFGAAASTELNRFVVYFALPALMVDAILKTPWATFNQPHFFFAFQIGVILIFFAVLIWRWRKTRDLYRATIECTTASYGNTGFIGLPFCALTFGADNLAPAIIAAILTVSANFALSIIFIEAGAQKNQGPLRSIRNVSLALIKNPLVISPIIAIALRLADCPIPEFIGVAIKLLADAASPCALVSIGFFLGMKTTSSDHGSTMAMVIIKLFVHPAIAWFLAYHVFHMPPLWAKSAVLLSAMPVGTGPFMLAELYQKGGDIASRTILLSTFGSIISLSIWLAIL